ncbi:MAG: transporter [Rhodocyclaceae bacterium]|jgi:hypothetical protein|nr:transporter [Rhodocyclaceae bacterium]
MKRLLRAVLLAPIFAALPARAHHGVAGVGAAALEGPGAPVESASSAVLPAGKTLLYAKLDHAKFKTFDADPTHPESDYADFWMVGVGHGFTPWFSAYVFAPHHAKIDEPGGLDSKGWADVSVMGQIGFKYDDGLKLVPAHESLDDLEDWHFTVFFGGTLPTGDANHRLADGSIDPGKSLGFGKPSFNLGFTATRQLSRDATFNLEASTIRFQEYRYADGNTMKFGGETRLNLSLAQRLFADAERRLRVDGVLEAQYLRLGRDIENGVPAEASGGKVLYLLPGVRLYKGGMSFACGIKKAVWTKLNESAAQQGAEGKEKYRLIFSVSTLF